MATVSDLNKGSYVRYNGEVVQVEELQHRTPGNLRAFYQIKMRSLRTGKIVENRFRPGDSIEQLRVETKEYQYLYQDGESLVCMDNATFEQIYLDRILLGDSVNYIKEGVTLLIAFEDGGNPITAEAPAHVVMNVGQEFLSWLMPFLQLLQGRPYRLDLIVLCIITQLTRNCHGPFRPKVNTG